MKGDAKNGSRMLHRRSGGGVAAAAAAGYGKGAHHRRLKRIKRLWRGYASSGDGVLGRGGSPFLAATKKRKSADN